jgi:uncharacterized protein YcbX
MRLGRVAEVWRYPVNGLQGENLTASVVLTTGISGDHLYAIRDTRTNKVLDPKSYPFSWGESLGKPAMLELSAKLSGEPEGEHEVSIAASGRTICTTKDPEMNRLISAALGDSLELVRYPRFAESRVRSGRALHLLTTASLARMSRLYPGGDFNPRRFRPNIIVATEDDADGCVEEGWVGKDISLGGIRLHVEKPNMRCKVTTMRQPGIREDPRILETIQRENGSNLGVLCTALIEGSLRVGDSVALA